MRTIILIALSLAAACTKPEQYIEKRSSFQLFAERIGFEPPCSMRIPMEWAPSYPIPTLIDGRLHYRVFFYGWQGRPDIGIKYHDAEGDALFSADGKVFECSQRGKRGKLFSEPGLPVPTMDEFESRQRALYSTIEEMGRLYAKGMPVLGPDRARVKAFAAEFWLLSGPEHAASYRALNPEFWAWVEKNGGAAPAK